jgi:hypothetical protein
MPERMTGGVFSEYDKAVSFGSVAFYGSEQPPRLSRVVIGQDFDKDLFRFSVSHVIVIVIQGLF